VATAKKPTHSNKDKAKDKVEDAVVIKDTAPIDAAKAKAQVSEDTPKAEKRNSVFVPMLVGGVLSGAVGFGAASYYFMNKPSDAEQALVQVQATLKDQQAHLATADDKIASLRSGLENSAAAQETADGFDQSLERDKALSAQIDALATVVDGFDARITTLEKRPIAEAGGVTSEAAAAYERELKTMRDLLAIQRNDIEKLAAEATSRIENVAQQAQAAEQAAEDTAKTTAVRVAVSQLQSALDNGGAFSATVSNLAGSGVEIPTVLSEAAESGVPTLVDLQDSFPAAARAALAVSVKATTGDGAMDKIGAFFRSQVGARSLEPREGDDPDAVLSRAEAALGAGDISGAIGLIAALPEVGQVEMSDWVSQANVRLQAVDAVQALADSLNGN